MSVLKNLEKVKEIIYESISYSECMIKLGYNCKGGGTFTKLKKLIADNNIDISHFKGCAHGKSRNIKINKEDVFRENSTYINNTSLKSRLIKDYNFKEKCSICGISEWMGNKLSLQLDHINGINKDNRVENLRLLCPNCHSQTETFSGSNKLKD